MGLPGTAGNLVVTTSLVLFAFSTLVGWSYYGETGVVYLFGAGAAVPYRVLWLIFIYLDGRETLGHAFEYIWATPEGWDMQGWPKDKPVVS